MPELPEVETVRRGLAGRIVGRSITKVDMGRDRVARRTSTATVAMGLTGTTITAVDRRGKYLLIRLTEERTAMVHLRMSGQLLIAPSVVPRPKHCHVAAHLDDGNELRFVDPRTFGEVVVYATVDEAVVVPELARLGRDPLVDGVSRAVLADICAGRQRRLKSLLLDQSAIAGIGNIYADEICHRARLRPDRPAATLHRLHLERLAEAMVSVLNAAVTAGGSTLGDAQYVGVDGQAGSFQDEHRVHARAGLRCGTCGRGIVRRMVIDQRSTYWCGICQR